MNTTIYQNRPEDTQNWANLFLEPHDYRIYYVNNNLRHQYGLSAAESQMVLFLCLKLPPRRRVRRNRCFRRLVTTQPGEIDGSGATNDSKLQFSD